VAIHVPSVQLNPAVSAARAATFAAITKSDGPILTITPTPVVATITGPNKPAYTFLSNAQDGHAPGDLAINLDEELATKITDEIRQHEQCDSSQSPPFLPVQGAIVNIADVEPIVANIVEQIGAIVCAAQQLIENGAGYFKDMAALSMAKPDWALPEMGQAMAEHVSWAVQWADNMGIDPADATTFAFWSFILAYQVIKSNAPLTKVNWISGNDLKGNTAGSVMPSMTSNGPAMTITASASTSSFSVLECTASCTYVGVMRGCETWCATPTGDQYYYDRPDETVIKTIAIDPWIVPAQVPIERPTVELPIAICPPPPGNATEFPSRLFSSVHTKFCKELEGNNDNAAMTVNWKGDRHPSLKSRLLRFMSRDDVSDDAKYKDYKITLGRYVRDGSSSTCSVSCDVAFHRFSSQNLCLRGDDNKEMASTGVLDTGCALYSFSIEPPQPTIGKTEVTCRDPKLGYTAPKYDKSATSGAIGIESAIKIWCAENGLKQVIKGGTIPYGRWPISQINVPNRSSFWPRAQVHGNNNNGIILYDQCVAAFTEGLKTCEPDSDMTRGFSALYGSLEYSIDVSGWTQEGNPLWDQKVFFPPADDMLRKGGSGTAFASECCPNNLPGERIDEVDFEKAIDGFCRNGAELDPPEHDWENMFVYPPQSQPAFYATNPGLPDERLCLGAHRLDASAYADSNACR
jgi:hypothetical protein